MKSSAGRSKAGKDARATRAEKRPAPGPPRAAASERSPRLSTPGGLLGLLERFERNEFPATLYLDGPSEPVKAALLAELRFWWSVHCPEAPLARVMRTAETGVEEILGAYQGASLFCPRELIVVLEIEDLGRSEKRVSALARGFASPVGSSVLVLVESAAENPPKALEPIRAAAAVRATALPLERAGLLAWGARRLAREEVRAEPQVLAAVIDACEEDPLAFFSELDKLCTWTGRGGLLRLQDATAILRPAVGAGLPDYLGAVALGRPGIAAQRLGRLLAEGVSEGTALFALSNLVGGALGGWARHRELSAALRRRLGPRELGRALDVVYRAEMAWKGGRADAVAVLEHATREIARPSR